MYVPHRIRSPGAVCFKAVSSRQSKDLLARRQAASSRQEQRLQPMCAQTPGWLGLCIRMPTTQIQSAKQEASAKRAAAEKRSNKLLSARGGASAGASGGRLRAHDVASGHGAGSRPDRDRIETGLVGRGRDMLCGGHRGERLFERHLLARTRE